MRGIEPPYLSYLFTKAKNEHIPLAATFELTARCNFNCKMCYIHNENNERIREDELTTEQWIKIADDAQKAGTLMVLITGGEPLLRDDFKEIYIHCKNLGFEININTNGSLITDELIDTFKEYPPAKISITLYGSNEEKYSEVIRRKGYYDKVVSNIIKLKEAGLSVKINITISEQKEEEIAELYKFIKENAIHAESSCYLFTSMRSEQKNYRPDYLTAAHNTLLCEKYSNTDEFMIKRAKAISMITESTKEPCEIGEPVPCRAGLAAFWITYNGKMIPCGMLPTPCESAKDDGIAVAWKKINEQMLKYTMPPECKNCGYKNICDVCAASCYTETGYFNKVPEYVCKKAHVFAKLITEEYKNEI